MKITNTSNIAPSAPPAPASAPAPQPGSISISISAAWVEECLPGKPAPKREAWLQVLLDNEFETVAELASLSQEDWASLPLPLAVRSALRNKAQADAAAPPAPPAAPAPQQAEPAVDVSSAPVDVYVPPPVSQVDAILIDVSGSMRAASVVDYDKTREDVSKQLFHTLVDRLVTMELQHELCLVSFGQLVTTIKDFTRQYERFHDELGRLDANQGQTKLWDAMFQAGVALNDRCADMPATEDGTPVVKRIFALTDGQDNGSTHAAWQVAQFLQEHKVVVDSIPLGGPNRQLGAMSKACGGVCFTAESNEQMIGLFQREATLHVSYREQPEDVPLVNMQTFAALQGQFKTVTNIKSKVSKVALQASKRLTKEALTQRISTVSKSKKFGGKSGNALKRVLKEYGAFQAAGCTAYMNDDDVTKWKVVLRGPESTPYEGFHFLLTFDFPASYPFQPVRVRFQTPIYHCNVSEDGVLCLDILKDQWTPALSASSVCESLISLLQSPNYSDPLDAWKGELCRLDRNAYNKNVADHAKTHAAPSAQELCAKYNLD